MERLIRRRTSSAREKTEGELLDLAEYFSTYCCEKHERVKALYINSWGLIMNPNHKLCPECQELLNYSINLYLRCPHSPKPDCKKCDNLCFAPAYRLRFQEVIRFVEGIL